MLITFEASIIFEASGEVTKIGLSLKPNPHKQIKPRFSLSKYVKRSVDESEFFFFQTLHNKLTNESENKGMNA